MRYCRKGQIAYFSRVGVWAVPPNFQGDSYQTYGEPCGDDVLLNESFANECTLRTVIVRCVMNLCSLLL